MQGTLRMIAVLVVVTLAAAMPGVHALAFPAVPVGHPAGCHSHRPTTPSPEPPSYQCCVSGHDAAIPSASFFFRPPAAQLCSWYSDQGFRFGFVPSLRSGDITVSSNGPPNSAPLRI